MAPISGNDSGSNDTEEENNSTTPAPPPPVGDTSEAGEDVDVLPLWAEGNLNSNSSTESPSRSSSRSGRSRHRHRHRRRRSRFRFKRKESNFLAAVSSMIVLVLLCTAMAEPRWFFLRGGGCRLKDGSPVNYLGVNQFFYMGSFLQLVSTETHVKTEYKYGPVATEVLYDCVTPPAVPILKSIITFCFFGVAFSLVAFILDVAGPSHRLLKILRRNAIFNILTVAVCITINGFSYWAATALQAFQEMTQHSSDKKAIVQFSVSFYLVTASGVMSVIAAATNLLRRSYHHSDHHGDRDRLLEEYDALDFAGIPRHQLCSPMTGLPPPPPYSP